MFLREAAQLREAFGQQLVSIHHIGSTSVRGMAAKPIIDMMPVVRHIARVEKINSAMIRLGYEPRGEYGIPGRRYFVKGRDEQRTHHIHAYQSEHSEVARHLNFRDYLISHPVEAQRYASLKIDLAKQFPSDIGSYMAGKDSLIKEILGRAARWRIEQDGGDVE